MFFKKMYCQILKTNLSFVNFFGRLSFFLLLGFLFIRLFFGNSQLLTLFKRKSFPDELIHPYGRILIKGIFLYTNIFFLYYREIMPKKFKNVLHFIVII